MQQREKILAGLLAGTVGIWFGLPVFESAFLAPLQDLERQETSLMEQVETKTSRRLQLAVADRDLTEWRGLSLPPDPLSAQRLYQEWLTDLAEMSGFQDTKITLDRRVPEGDTYTTIPVTLETKGTLQELAQFLERFHSVELLHRIARCDIVSKQSEGNPELELLITAEGVSIRNSKPRARLFPETIVRGELTRSERTIEVENTEEFPEEVPFLARIGSELVNVTAVQGNEWELQRGVQRTFAEDHGQDATIELFPVRDETVKPETVQQMWANSLFTKPAPKIDYDPKLASNSPPPVIQGKEWSWKMDVASWDPANGSPLFQLFDGPRGMEVDERTGTLYWKVDEDFPVGDYAVEAVIWGEGNQNAGFTAVFDVKVREPNLPPKVEPIDKARFFLGRETIVPVKAVDPEEDRLSYALDGAPEGMRVSPSGEIIWQPDLALETRTGEFTLRVMDSDEFQETVSLRVPFSLEEDSARFAYLVACLDLKPVGKEAWIYDRATNKKTVLHTGDQVQIADFDFKVKDIENEAIIVEQESGTYRLGFDQPLSQMTRVAVPQEETAKADTTETESLPDEKTQDATAEQPTGTEPAKTEPEKPPAEATDEAQPDSEDSNTPSDS